MTKKIPVIFISLFLFASCAAPLQNLFAQNTTDSEFQSIASSAPEFAGYYYVGETIHINVASEDPEAQQRVLDVLEAQEPLFRDGNPMYVIDTVKFSFAQLSNWYQEIYNPIYSVDGITSSGIDEATNKITITVAKDSQITAMEEVIAPFNVPSDAIQITVQAPFQPDNEETETDSNTILIYGGLALAVVGIVFIVWKLITAKRVK